MKLKIINKSKFIISSTILFTIIIFIISAFINTTLSHEEIQYKSISVIYGDTLWSIAKEESKYNNYYYNKDIRYIIDDIKLHNNLKETYLQEGQILLIPER